MRFSPDGSRIVTGSWDATARVWETQSGKLLTTLVGHEDGVVSAQFSPDGSQIVTASPDGTVRMWETQRGKLLATIAGYEGDECGVAQFSLDGSRIVTASLNGTAQVWETQSGKLLAALAGNGGKLDSAQFSPDGTRIVTASRENIARVWTLLSPQAGPPPDWFPDFLRYLAQMRLNSAGVNGNAQARRLARAVRPNEHPAARERSA